MAKFKVNIEETSIMHHYITVEAEDEDALSIIEEDFGAWMKTEKGL